MTKKHTILMLISIFALWINSFFNTEVQFYSGYLLIFLVGILHGSNDIILIKKTLTSNSLSNAKLILYYIILVLIGFAMFYFIPTIGLLLFIIVSSYHFGEQHWNTLLKGNTKTLTTLFQTTYGLFIFMLLFKFNEIEVSKIICSITKSKIVNFNFSLILFTTSIILLLIGFVLYQYVEKFRKHILINLVYLLIFCLVFKTADLIWGFAIYFVVWHSLPSIKDQILFIYGEISIRNIKLYIYKALPFWLVSLSGILVLFLLFKDETIFETLFFSFLAAITFPHVFIMVKLIAKKKSNK